MKFTNIYIKNFGEDYTDEKLKGVFSTFGKKGYSFFPPFSPCLYFLFWEREREGGPATPPRQERVFFNSLSCSYLVSHKTESVLVGMLVFISTFAEKKSKNNVIAFCWCRYQTSKPYRYWCVLKFSGKTLSVRVMKDERGRSRGFGFVNYANHDDAQKVACAKCLQYVHCWLRVSCFSIFNIHYLSTSQQVALNFFFDCMEEHLINMQLPFGFTNDKKRLGSCVFLPPTLKFYFAHRISLSCENDCPHLSYRNYMKTYRSNYVWKG